MTKKYQYKLSKIVSTKQSFLIDYLKDGEIQRNKTVIVEPDKIYETADEILINSLKGKKNKIPYSPNNLRFIEDFELEYKLEKCASCGGITKKIVLNYFDIQEVSI